jgi:glycosyltransferase involved in cell wall biosynthesis
MKKRIVVHYPHLQFMQGGTKFLLEVLKRLQKKYEVTLVCNNGKLANIEAFRNEGVQVVTTSRFSTNNLIYWAFFPVFVLLDIIASARYMKQADVLLSFLYPSNLITAICAALFQKRHVFYCYEPFPYLQNWRYINTFSAGKRLFMSILAVVYGWTDTLATKSAHVVLTLNTITQNFIRDTYGIDSVVSLMGVDTVHFKPVAQNKIKQHYPGRTLIVHSTDYTTMKRTDLALDALKNLSEKFPEILLLVTSTQPDSPAKAIYQKQAEQLGIEKNVEFLGWIDYKDLPLYYAAAACYLSCSYDEMLGTTSSNLPVKEALSCQTPAIRANITTEDVEDGVSGFLVDPRNASQVAEKIRYIITHPKEAAAMGKKGRTKIQQLYNWDEVTSIIENALIP